MKCVLEKLPEQERAAALAGMKRSAKVWNATAATEAGKADLAETCKSAATAWGQAAVGLGCDW
jgi:hypothetical protein